MIIIRTKAFTDESDWRSMEMLQIVDSEKDEILYRKTIVDLTDCPEDATLGRDLIGVGELCSAFELGLKYNADKVSYTDIECKSSDEFWNDEYWGEEDDEKSTDS